MVRDALATVVEVLRLDHAGDCGRRAAEGRVRGRWRRRGRGGGSEPEPIVVTDAARAAGGVEHDSQHMLTSAERNRGDIERLPRLPPAGIWDGNRAGLV